MLESNKLKKSLAKIKYADIFTYVKLLPSYIRYIHLTLSIYMDVTYIKAGLGVVLMS